MLASTQLYQIIYHSLASAPTGMSANELAALLRQSRAANQGNRITGLLLYARLTHEFVQVLEGPHSVVQQTYARIAHDPRHKHAFVLHEDVVTSRMFPDWRMGFALAQPQDLRDTTGYFPLVSEPAYARPPGLAVHAPEQLRRLLSDFAAPVATDTDNEGALE